MRVMPIFIFTWSGDFSMRFPEEIEAQLKEFRRNFMQEDTAAGLIQGWLDDYKGDYVCSQMLYHEALGHPDSPPKRATNEICEIMDTAVTGWKEGPTHRFSKEGYGIQRSWVRTGENVNGGDFGGFEPVPEAEQLTIPFDEPDRKNTAR